MLQEISQYKLTTDLVANLNKLEIKDSSFKVLMIFSVHYPNILITRKTLIERYELSESSVDRAIKELLNKTFILKVKDKFAINLKALYRQFEGSKVVNLKTPCINIQHEQTNQTNIIDDAILSTLTSWGFNDAEKIIKEHSEDKIKNLIALIKEKNPGNKGAYLRSLLKVSNIQFEDKKQNRQFDADLKTRLAAKASYLNDRDCADRVLKQSTVYNSMNKKSLRQIVEIQLKWNFDVDEFCILQDISDRMNQDPNFAKGMRELTKEVQAEFKACSLGLAV